ncbi:MAG: ArsR family transcriptional regulator [Candidatus Altiarchaeota archaeon]|nr:ArsR family transcriptional regulator [Candidatus Altiarchaeota archaeon]
MEYEILSHLLLSGEKSVKEIAELLKISETYASKLTDRMERENLVSKKRSGRQVIVKPNTSSPLVKEFSRFVVIVGNHPPYTPKDFLTPESKRIITKSLIKKPKSIKEIKKETKYSRVTINKTLKSLKKSGIVKTEDRRPRKYHTTDSPLTKALTPIIEYLELGIRSKNVLNRIASDPRTEALVVYGSEVWGRKDELSDVDAFVVVDSPENVKAIKEYEQEGLELNAFSRKGLVHLIRREPWFFRLILQGKILTGEDFLKDISDTRSKGDTGEVVGEIKEMLEGLDRITSTEKAKILMYCIRSLLVLRLHQEDKLSWENYYRELDKEYPRYKEIRRMRHGLGEVKAKDIENIRDKLLKEIGYVKKEQKKISNKP